MPPGGHSGEPTLRNAAYDCLKRNAAESRGWGLAATADDDHLDRTVEGVNQEAWGSEFGVKRAVHRAWPCPTLSQADAV